MKVFSSLRGNMKQGKTVTTKNNPSTPQTKCPQLDSMSNARNQKQCITPATYYPSVPRRTGPLRPVAQNSPPRTRWVDADISVIGCVLSTYRCIQNSQAWSSITSTPGIVYTCSIIPFYLTRPPYFTRLLFACKQRVILSDWHTMVPRSWFVTPQTSQLNAFPCFDLISGLFSRRYQTSPSTDGHETPASISSASQVCTQRVRSNGLLSQRRGGISRYSASSISQNTAVLFVVRLFGDRPSGTSPWASSRLPLQAATISVTSQSRSRASLFTTVRKHVPRRSVIG